MLGKLMKYEWKNTYKAGGLMVFATLIVTFIGWLSFQSPMWRAQGGDDLFFTYRISPLDLLSMVSVLMWVFLLVGISYGMIIYLGVHFYKTMYTDQGYLTHTLPVGKHELLLSRILVDGLWALIITACVALSVFAVVSSLIGSVSPEYSLWEIWSQVGELLSELLWDMRKATGVNFSVYLIYWLVAALVGPFVTLTILYGCITIGQLFTKVRVLMAIVCYIGVTVVTSLISSLVQSIAAMYSQTFHRYMDISVNVSFLVQLITAALLYVVSYQIISKKLNME